WSPPLALFPASIPAISGDKTNIVGCARAWCTFLLLGATSESPPFAADVDVKPAGR
ncbi:Os02g0454300, partial [Oryza sativa Japonica Group]